MSTLNNTEFRTIVVQPAIKAINMYSANAEELLVATMAHESMGGKYLCQIGTGPACGVFQMEPATYDDVWAHEVEKNPSLKRLILSATGYVEKPPAKAMIVDMKFATIMARVDYARFREPLPSKDDITAIWNYYKKYWNTSAGKATQKDFIAHYKHFVC